MLKVRDNYSLALTGYKLAEYKKSSVKYWPKYLIFARQTKNKIQLRRFMCVWKKNNKMKRITHFRQQEKYI